MRVTLVTANVVVIDGVMGSGLADLRASAGQLAYERVNAVDWRPVWRLDSGLPLQGPTGWLGEKYDSESEEVPGFGEFVHRIDEALRLAEVADVIGSEGIEWQAATFSPWIYPSGTGLGLHVDGRRYTGAFTFYFHREWRMRWGGLLLVPEVDGSALSLPVFDDDAEASLVADPGIALAVLPLPDRLVFLSEGAAHLITRVDEAAGDRMRLSVSGFFHRKGPESQNVGPLRPRDK